MTTSNRADVGDWRHPRDVDPDAYKAMLLESKPFKDKEKAIEAEIETWKAKARQNIINGKCSWCQSPFRQGLSYPQCSNYIGCPESCEYCLVNSVEGCMLCPCGSKNQ
jgi:hypothetical protein